MNLCPAHHSRDKLSFCSLGEECIGQCLIPAILGRNVSEDERPMLALPVRYGRLQISNPVEACECGYEASLCITRELSSLIHQQQQDLSLFDTEEQLSVVKEVLSVKRKSS